MSAFRAIVTTLDGTVRAGIGDYTDRCVDALRYARALGERRVAAMETVTVVLSVANDRVEEFEAGFHQHELPTWEDYLARGILTRATLSRMDISSRPVEGATQYLIAVLFPTGEGHHLHDSDPRFQAWNEMADAYQIADAMAFGGETIVSVGG